MRGLFVGAFVCKWDGDGCWIGEFSTLGDVGMLVGIIDRGIGGGLRLCIGC